MSEQAREAISTLAQGGVGADPDDHLYRRLTSGAKFQTRDLTPLSQDRALEVAWYLHEQNPFAHRLIGLMTDLIIGEGATVEVAAANEQVQAVVQHFWSRNQINERLRSFHTAWSLNGELCFPVGINPISGGVVIGYIDSAQIKAVIPNPDNVLEIDEIVLKRNAGEQDERRLKVIREDPATGRLVGDCFFARTNALPNSMRGRSDLLPLADWLDLYDQFMFGEAERVTLASMFTFDYRIEGGDDKTIKAKVGALPRIKPGMVFGHNEKETLDLKSPDLKMQDRSELARLLRVHIAGGFGFPVSYVGDIDSNKATIEGQNDVLMKTPAARQKEFGGLLHRMIRFAVEQAVYKNPVLFRDGSEMVPVDFRVSMPEIAAKDVARVGTVLASVASAMDTSISNKTMSRQTAVRVIASVVSHLGIQIDPAEVAAEIETERDEQQEVQDMLQAELARRRLAGPTNPGVDDVDDEDDEDDDAAGRGAGE